jgi:hypothetical protein
MAEVARRVLPIAVALALACTSTYYDEYRAAHPDFDPTLPRVDATLPELLAALHAPDRVETIEVGLSQLAIFRVTGEEWEAIPFESIRRGTADLPPDSDYVVLAVWTCRFARGLQEGGRERGGFYLLPGNRLAAYDHYSFRDACIADNEFRAARGALVKTEQEALERISGAGARLSLAQAYQRGLAYVEAGRLPEARAMLVIGERSFRSAAQELREGGRPDALADAMRMRAALMRALGVEARDPP